MLGRFTPHPEAFTTSKTDAPRYQRRWTEQLVVALDRAVRDRHLADPGHDLDSQLLRGMLARARPVDERLDRLPQAVLPQARPALVEVLGDASTVGVSPDRPIM